MKSPVQIRGRKAGDPSFHYSTEKSERAQRDRQRLAKARSNADGKQTVTRSRAEREKKWRGGLRWNQGWGRYPKHCCARSPGHIKRTVWLVPPKTSTSPASREAELSHLPATKTFLSQLVSGISATSFPPQTQRSDFLRLFIGVSSMRAEERSHSLKSNRCDKAFSLRRHNLALCSCSCSSLPRRKEAKEKEISSFFLLYVS